MNSASLLLLVYFGIARGIAPHHLVAIVFIRLSGLRTVCIGVLKASRRIRELMNSVRRSPSTRLAILCEDSHPGVPKQRILEIPGGEVSDLYPLSASALDFIEGDFICVARLESPALRMLSQSSALEISLPELEGAPDGPS
jgi:hypothetical protein